MAPRDFYLNPAERCGTLFTTCEHTCLGGLNTGPEANITNPAFCDAFSGSTKQFACDQQVIQCGPLPPAQSSSLLAGPGLTQTVSDLAAYLLNADIDRDERLLRCSKLTIVGEPFPNSLRLDCTVSNTLFVNRADSCQTILSECINNLGTLQCIEPYVSTTGHPFCTVQLFADKYWQQYWCLFSLTHPVAVCAVRPGYRLPLCTVECPPGLVRTSINGSVAHYCCRDTDSCQLDDDNRNCVLGRHDPTLVDDPRLTGTVSFWSPPPI